MLFRLIVAVAALVAAAPAALAANDFLPVKLPHGVQIELPRNWQVVAKGQRIVLNSPVLSASERAKFFDASSNLNFVAAYYDEAGKAAATLNVRYHPDSKISQTDARAAGESDLRELDRGLRESAMKLGPTDGFSVLAWSGTRKQAINGVTAFVTEYKRSPIKDSGIFLVRLVRIFNADKSFTLTISYRESQGILLRPISDRIISSLRT